MNDRGREMENIKQDYIEHVVNVNKMAEVKCRE